MRRSISHLSNLAFLYLLSGGMLPHGFDNVAGNIEAVTGVNIKNLQGMGTEGEDDGDWGSNDADHTGGDNTRDVADDTVNGDNGNIYVAQDETGGTGQVEDYGDYTGGDHGGTYNTYDSSDGFGGGNDGVAGADDIDCDCIGDVLQSLLDG